MLWLIMAHTGLVRKIGNSSVREIKECSFIENNTPGPEKNFSDPGVLKYESYFAFVVASSGVAVNAA